MKKSRGKRNLVLCRRDKTRVYRLVIYLPGTQKNIQKTSKVAARIKYR